MRKIKYLSSFIIAFVVGFFVINYNGNELTTRITDTDSNTKNTNETYYEDYSGNLWKDKNSYEDYRDDNYFVAPDGTVWINEYRYELSKK